MEIDLQERWQSTQWIVGRRDAIIRRIAYSLSLMVVAGRTPIAEAGWDASYILRADDRVFRIVDFGVVREQELAEDVLKQVQAGPSGPHPGPPFLENR